MNRIDSKLFCALVLFALVPQAGRADCFGPASPCEAWANAQAVWLGTVEKAEVGESDPEFGPITYLVTMVVDEVFSGKVKAGDQMHFEEYLLGEGSVVPKLGERYLVYAANSDGTRFSLNMCSGSKRLEWAEDDLEYARRLKGKAPPGSLRGVVGAISRTSPSSPRLEGVRVTIQGHSGRFETETDRDGQYVFENLAPGRYRMDAYYPDYQARWYEEPIAEVPTAGCAHRDIVMTPVNGLSGRVFDQLGEPLEYIVVEVVPLPPLRKGDMVNNLAITIRDGRFQFSGLQAGQYRLGVNITSGPDDEQPYAATFFPGTPDWTQAAVLTLGPTTRLANLDIRLGPRLGSHEIRGRVLHPDGSSAVKARVGAFDPRHFDRDYRHYSEVEWTDETGAFGLTVFEGILYRLEASQSVSGGSCAPVVDAPAKDDPAKLVLVLSMDETACKQQRQAQVAGPHGEPQ